MPGTGKTHLARQIVAQLSEKGEAVTLISKTHCSVQNLGLGADGGPLGAAHGLTVTVGIRLLGIRSLGSGSTRKTE